MSQGKFKIRNINLLLMSCVLFITIFVYYGVSSYGFVNWDDDENIRVNPRFTEFSQENIFYHYQHDRYKALAIWSYMAEYQIFGDNSGMYHIDNLILHLINTVLVFIFIRMLVPKNRFAPLITAAFFAVHPAFVEPVAWVTGRKDLLFVMFSLLSMIAYFRFLIQEKWKIRWIYFALVFICVYLASLAKIQAVALPVVFIAIDFLYQRKTRVFNLAEKLILLLICFDYFLPVIALLLLGLMLKFYKHLIGIITKSKSSKIISIVLLLLVVSALQMPFKYFLKEFPIFAIEGFNNNLILWIIYLIFISYVIFNKFFDRIANRLKENGVNKHRKWIAPVFFISIIFVVVIKFDSILSQFTGLWNYNSGSEHFYSIWERILFLSGSMVYYLKRFFLLQAQDPMIPYPERGINGAMPDYLFTDFIAVLIIVALSAFVLFRYFRKNRVVLFGVAFFLINIGLVLHIIPIEGRVLVADRYTYLAYIGLFLLIGLLADRLAERQKRPAIIAGAGGLILLFVGFTTYRDKAAWENSFTLWQKALVVNPENHYAMYSLALAYFSEGQNASTAENYLNEAILMKQDFMYYNNRGRVRYSLGNLRGALSDFDKAIAMDSTNFASYNNRGAVRQQFCDYRGALIDYAEAIRIFPDYQEAKNNKRKVEELILLDSLLFAWNDTLSVPRERLTDFVLMATEKLISSEQTEKALLYLDAGMKIYPAEARFYEKTAVIFHLKNQYAEAKKYYDRGLQEVPENTSLLLGRGLLFIQTGDTAKACIDLQIAAEKGDADAKNLLQQFCK